MTNCESQPAPLQVTLRLEGHEYELLLVTLNHVIVSADHARHSDDFIQSAIDWFEKGIVGLLAKIEDQARCACAGEAPTKPSKPPPPPRDGGPSML